uniref:Amino acid transporter transmembrane domain-containing protein n=1 Tax=Clastoptera arizonana TaxID=38151 RepID=A0A1B6CN84_9HEMI
MEKAKKNTENHTSVELSSTNFNEKKEATGKFAIRDDPLATTDFDALLHVIKSSLGSGILAMPDAFKNSGLIFGLIGTIFVGILCTHGTYLIVKCSQELCYLYQKTSLGYTETVETAFQNSHSSLLKRYSHISRRFVKLFLFLTYYGTNTVYILLISSTIQQVAVHRFDIDWNIRWFMIILFVPLLPVAMVHQMKYLVPFSAIANVLLLLGLSLTLYYTMIDLPPISERPAITHDLSKIPLFFSTVLCGMEGIGTILPIENSMRNPRNFLRCPGVLNNAMIIIATLFGSIGFIGYLKFGDNVQGSITLNLGNDILAESVKMSVALAVFFTYTLQFTACFEVAWATLKPYVSKENQVKAFYIMRGFLIFGTVCFGIIVPQLAPVISLVGSIGFSMLGLFLPALTETVIFWNYGLGIFRWRLYKNIFMMIIACLTLFSGTSIAIKDISSNYK